MNSGAELLFHGSVPRRRASDTIHIGLVNNMPDAALRATEIQFARLLKDAAGPIDVRLRLFSFPEIVRSELAQSRMEGHYANAAALPDAQIDAVIVTGAEPIAADLRDEAYWQSFAKLVDWAQTGTVSTLFSCLAAHAGVLHLDGIKRRLLPHKLSGVFDCDDASDDALLLGSHGSAAVPHSRHNELAEKDLTAKGYSVLSRLRDGGVNLFAREEQSLFVFLQGHPEYDRETLGREYCRDIGRFLRGERNEMPAMPQNYFDPATQNALRDLNEKGRDPALLPHYSEIAGRALPLRIWRDQSVNLFGNWLALIAAEKARRRSRESAETVQRNLRRSA